MSNFISERIASLNPSDIRNMSRECYKVGGINLSQGVCDMPTPPLVRDGAIQAIENRKSIYSLPEGVHELRNAIAEKLKRENGIQANADTDIVVSVGATGAFVSTLMALLNPGDGVLMFEPYYGYHISGITLAGLQPHLCTLHAPDFTIDEANVRAAIKENTKAIVLCTPGNPSGKMLTEAEIDLVAKIAHEKNLLVISDEIYEHYRYEDRQHISTATVADLYDRTVTIMGLSKTFSITGWRIGYTVAKQEMSQHICKANDQFYVCAPTPLQYGVAKGFETPEEYFVTLRADFQTKRDRFCSALEEVGLRPIVPQGSYYVLADVSRLQKSDSYAAAMHILEKTKIACVPGRAFYKSQAGDNLVRFCFAVEDEVLDKACEHIKKL